MLVATTTPDEVMPNAAPLVAHELGAMRAGAFDIGAACTGFLSALAVGTGQIEAGRAQCVVVIGADFMSRILDPDDRTTAAVFADGAGAVVLQATGETSRIGPIVLGADGAGADHINVPRDGGRDPHARPRDFPRGRRAPVAGDRPGRAGPPARGSTTSTCSSTTRPTGGS